MLELYSHNQIAYDNAKFVFETQNKTAIVHATGTGKSLIVAKFIVENPNAKSLFISPNIFIHKEIKKHIRGFLKNVQFQTYQYFGFNSVKEFVGYDYIFLDEFHRVGAGEWNKKINELIIQNPNAKILGTSATHIRYLDNERNMANEIFDGNISSYLSLGEAIEKGIHKKPKYVSALYNIKEIIDDTEQRLKRNNKKKELENLKSRKVVWEESNGIDFILNKHLTHNRKKILVFCKSIEHIKFIQNLIIPILSKFYNNIEFNTIHSYISYKNEKIFSHFEKSNVPQVIFCVDMLNEGIHVKGVDTIMMFRDTSSPIIYFQQMGRCFAVGQNLQPLIFDFVNNFSIKNSVGSIIQNFYNNFNIENKEHFFQKRNLIIDFYDETLDFENFLNEFSHFKTWNESYNELLLFVEKNQRLPKYSEIKWLHNQRVSYRNDKLLKKQIELINDIAPNFLQETFKTWDESYNELLLFVEKNQRLPKQSEMKWVNIQKSQFKKNGLTSKQINLLLKIDKNFFSNMKDWNSFYLKFKNLYQLKGRMPTQLELPWISSQKKLYKKGRLSQDKIDLLLQVDENFFLEKTKIKDWKTSFNELKDFYNKYNRVPLRTEMNWIANQIENYKKGKLSQDKIDLLLQVDENIFKINRGWMLRYDAFKDFYKLNKRLPLHSESTWLQTQINAYKGRKLSKEQIDLLLQVDENIFKNKSEIRAEIYFKNKLEELKKYIWKNGKIPTLREMPFVYSIRKKYKEDLLSKEQIDLLLQVDENIFK